MCIVLVNVACSHLLKDIAVCLWSFLFFTRASYFPGKITIVPEEIDHVSFYIWLIWTSLAHRIERFLNPVDLSDVFLW